MFQRVIAPLDGSQLSEKALAYAAEIARRFGARITLLRAFEGAERSARTLAMMQAGPGPDGMLDPTTVEAVTEAARAEQSEARAYLDDRARELQARGLDVDVLLVDAPPAEAITRAAHSEPQTLVVMSTHGRGGLGRVVFGSTAQEVVQHCYAPVLLVRAVESAITESGADISSQLSIGAEVIGTVGKLGEVHRLLVDASSNRVTDIVVKHGFLFGTERIVPLAHVTRVEGGAVFVDLDERGLEAMDSFAEDRYRAPGKDYPLPGRLDRNAYLLNAVAAEGPMAAMAPLPTEIPPAAQTPPADMQRPAIAEGMDVLDVDGRKVGEIGAFSVAPENGIPTHLTLRRGLLFKQDIELPIDWVQELGDEGVVLKVTKDQVEALT
jgi:nucleotide-binding universal stress UspA family protein/uncharacterized protein YrrD